MKSGRLVATTFGALLLLAVAGADITVDNFQPGEVVRNPLLVLRGHATGETIATGRDWTSASRFAIVRGEYRALVELKPGINMLVFEAGKETMRYRIDYRPMSNPRKYLAVWVRAQDEPQTELSATNRVKFGFGLKMLQCFYAEAMQEAGYGRKTFPLEFDPSGDVVVHSVTLPKSGAALRDMDDRTSWAYVYAELSKQFPEDSTQWCVMLGFTRYDPKSQKARGHYALGGGSLAAFGSLSLPLWPGNIADVPRVFGDTTVVDSSHALDDSNKRGTVWANVSTGLGAMAHEMGHTFGLPHAADPFSVMSRGFDYFSRTFTVDEAPRASAVGAVQFKPNEHSHWDPLEAAELSLNPYFQPDSPTPLPSVDPSIKVTGDDIVISAPNGLRLWGADRDDVTPTFAEFKPAEAPGEIRLSVKALREKLATDKPFRITAIDAAGRRAVIDGVH